MLSQAATGPNNAFIITPYGQDTGTMVSSAQQIQMLESLVANALDGGAQEDRPMEDANLPGGN